MALQPRYVDTLARGAAHSSGSFGASSPGLLRPPRLASVVARQTAVGSLAVPAVAPGRLHRSLLAYLGAAVQGQQRRLLRHSLLGD